MSGLIFASFKEVNQNKRVSNFKPKIKNPNKSESAIKYMTSDIQIGKQSKEYNTELIGWDLFAFHDPVINIVVEITIANLEMEVFKDSGIIHEVEAVVNIEVFFFGQNQRIFDQFIKGY